MKKYILGFLLLLIPVCAIQAQNNVTVADSLYKAGKYEEARKIYDKIIETDGISAGLLYNIGNTYYKLGDTGRAILNYERAKKLDPSNKLINQNLNYLTSKVLEANKSERGENGSDLDPDTPSFASLIYNLIAVEHKSNSWAVLAVISFILLVCGLCLYSFVPNMMAKKTGFYSGIVFFVFTVIFIIFALMAANNFVRKDEAVVVSYTAELYSKPDDKSKKVINILHSGTKLKIMDQEEEGATPKSTEWIKVKLNSDHVGWIKNQDIEII